MTVLLLQEKRIIQILMRLTFHLVLNLILNKSKILLTCWFDCFALKATGCILIILHFPHYSPYPTSYCSILQYSWGDVSKQLWWDDQWQSTSQADCTTHTGNIFSMSVLRLQDINSWKNTFLLSNTASRKSTNFSLHWTETNNCSLTAAGDLVVGCTAWFWWFHV